MTASDEYLPSEEPSIPPRFDPPCVKLETRGLTQQKPQRIFWHQNTVYKNSVAAKLRSINRDEEAQKLEVCHTEFTVAQCQGCGSVQKFPNRCDLFYCAECQPRLSSERRKAVEWWVREVKQPKHVVLTVKNVPDLTKAHVQQFRSWFTKLRRRTWAKNWRGGFYSMEVTNEGKGWHLHLHALVDAHWIDAIELSAQWAGVTNGFGRIVKVKDARRSDYLNEVTKYVVKGVQLAVFQPEQIAAFIDAFTGVRCFGVFGSLYGKRTQFSEWFELMRNTKPKCKCGCCEAWYFSEAEWAERDFVADVQLKSLPPPVAHPELPFTHCQLPPR